MPLLVKFVTSYDALLIITPYEDEVPTVALFVQESTAAEKVALSQFALITAPSETLHAPAFAVGLKIIKAIKIPVNRMIFFCLLLFSTNSLEIFK